jgi:hypothetical protein
MAEPEPLYHTWANDQERALVLHKTARSVERLQPVLRTQGSSLYLNVAPNNVSVRDGYSRSDYEYFRPDEARPERIKEAIRRSMVSYHGNAIVRNIFDLMSDFTVKGLQINHRNPRVERFYQEWFRRVRGQNRSERFASLLYRTANVVIKRSTAKLSQADEENLRRSVGATDLDYEEPVRLGRREIPLRYDFLNPLAIELLGDDLAPFVGPDSYTYALRIPQEVIRKVKNPRGKVDQALVSALPSDIRNAILAGDRMLPLAADKIVVHYYKRDDWQAWAIPMLTPLLKDLNMLEKMKLADLSALDGAISSIRVWKLGNLDAKLMPSEAVMQRLAEMLANNVGGGVMDLIWGPDIELVETSTDVYKFLGETKYAPVLSSIYAGLGIPPTLTGSGGSGSSVGGYTNNYISLKTLTERLEYGRGVLKEFWETEFRLVQQAMGFRYPAELSFDNLLTDEVQEKNLLLAMYDRDLIDIRTIQDRFDLDPDIIALRNRRDRRDRAEGRIGPKMSPLANQQHDLEKIVMSSGAYTPSQVGVDLKPTKKGEDPPLKVKSKYQPKQQPPGEPGQGRPLGKKDSQKRKQKTVKPRRTAAFLERLAWAEDAQTLLGKLLTPVYLKARGKDNLRQLTEEESGAFESFKFALLCAVPYGTVVSEETIGPLLAEDLPHNALADGLVKTTVEKWTEKHGKAPTLEQVRRWQAAAYTLSLETPDSPGNSSPTVSGTPQEPDSTA